MTSEESQIWLVSAILHIFSIQSLTPEYEFKTKEERNELEEVFLGTVTPLINAQESIISKGKEMVYESQSEAMHFVLGLKYPSDGPGLFDIKEYLDFSKPIAALLEEQFRSYRDRRNYPVIVSYTQYCKFLPLLSVLSQLVNLVLKLLRKFNHRVPEHHLHTTTLSEIVMGDEVELWNSLWSKVISMPKFCDTIFVPDEFKNLQLSTASSVMSLLPRRTGPGVCTWFMLNNLVYLHNKFAGGPKGDLISLSTCSRNQSISRSRLVKALYSAYKNGVFDFDLLEEYLTGIIGVKIRNIIDPIDCKDFLFHPLKEKGGWSSYLDMLPKLREIPSDILLTVQPTPLLLSKVETAIQLIARPNCLLSVGDVSWALQLGLPAEIYTKNIYYFWHHIWWHLSLANKSIFIPELCKIQCKQVSVGRINIGATISSDLSVTLHMLIVEWIIHYPGFDPSGWSLVEALEFYCEKRGRAQPTIDNVDIIPSGAVIEHAMDIWNKLIS